MVREKPARLNPRENKQLRMTFGDDTMQVTLSEGEHMIYSTGMWYLIPSGGAFKATWRKGRLFYTDKRIFWVHYMGKKEFEQPTEKIVKAALEKRKREHFQKSENVLVISFEHDGGRDEAFFSTKVPMLKKWAKLIWDNLPTSRSHHGEDVRSREHAGWTGFMAELKRQKDARARGLVK